MGENVVVACDLYGVSPNGAPSNTICCDVYGLLGDIGVFRGICSYDSMLHCLDGVCFFVLSHVCVLHEHLFGDIGSLCVYGVPCVWEVSYESVYADI